MSSKISLSAASSSNLLSLQQVARLMDKTQNILATGNKVNSAIDNPSSYYTARSLDNRATDLSGLLDSMSQKIQTIKAASEGINTATSYLEQMTSVAEQAISNPIPIEHLSDKELINEGYTLITSSMTASQINALIEDGAKLAFTSDVTLDDTINITASNVTFNGNGYAISYSGTQGFTIASNSIVASDSAIKISGDGAKISNVNIAYTNSKEQGAAVTIDGGKAEIDNIAITASTSAGARRVYGIQVIHKGELTLDSTSQISVSGDYSHKIVNGDPDFWDGAYNTQMIVDQMGEDNIAAWACAQFYTEGTEAGDWYLPGLGELADLYGTDYDKITTPAEGHGTTGATGGTKTKVNDTLAELKLNGFEAEQLTNGYYWSSSEYGNDSSWTLSMDDGDRTDYIKDSTSLRS